MTTIEISEELKQMMDSALVEGQTYDELILKMFLIVCEHHIME